MRCLLLALFFCCFSCQAYYDFLGFSLSDLDADVAHFKSLPIPEFQQAAHDYQSLARSGRFSPGQIVQISPGPTSYHRRCPVPKNVRTYTDFLKFLQNHHLNAHLNFDKKQKKDLILSNT